MTNNGASRPFELGARIPSARNAANDQSEPPPHPPWGGAAARCDEPCTSSHGRLSTLHPPTARLHVTVELAIGPSLLNSRPMTNLAPCSL